MIERTASSSLIARDEIIKRAIAQGATRYIAECDARVDAFVEKHYSFNGSLKLHSHALGWDLVRVPINIILSLVMLILTGIAQIAKRIRLRKLADLISQLPSSIETDLDRKVHQLIVTELLELPYQHGDYRSDKDALMQEIMKDPMLQLRLDQEMEFLPDMKDNPRLRDELDKCLAEYSLTRAAAGDLASNVLLLVTSKIALGNASFGVLSAGSAVSASVSNAVAISNFWLGSFVGKCWYSLFPVTASARMVISVTSIVAVLVAFFATFIGIVTDPIQAKLGIHQKRLRQVLGILEKGLCTGGKGQFQLYEKYMARIGDVFDVLVFLRGRL